MGISSGQTTTSVNIQKKDDQGNLLYLDSAGHESTVPSNSPAWVLVPAHNAQGSDRLFAGAVAESPVQTVQQESVVTLSGTAKAGDVWTLNLGGAKFDYTVRSGDDLNAVATGLAGVVDASALYAANSSSSALTVTLQTGGQPFTLAYSTTAADGAFAVEETPYEQRWQSASITLTDDLDGNGAVSASEVLKQGDVWSVTLDGTEFSYTAPSGATLTSIAQQLAQQINAADTAANIFTGRAAGGRTYVATATGARLAITNWTQKTFNLTGTATAGDVWTVTLDATPFSYTVLSGDTLESVAKALQDAIAEGTDFTASRSGSSSDC